MAFPAVNLTATTNGTTATTTPVVNVPTAGATDLLLVGIRVSGVGTIGWPGDWTEITENSADASDDVTAWGYRYGTSAVSTITLSSGNFKFSAVAYSITNAVDPAVQVPQISTIATGTSTAPDPPTLTPTGGAKDYLWVAFMGCEGEQTSPVTYPASYTNGITANSGTAGVVATNNRTAFAARQLNAANTDPAAFAISASDDWTAVTIAIHPANHQLVTPGVATLTLATFAPTISLTNNVTVTPDVAALALTTFAPFINFVGPITLRGVGALAASSTDTAVVTFALPAGSAANDVDYLFVQGSSVGDTDISDPSGWVRLGSLFLEVGTNDMELYVWRRVLQGSDAAPTVTVDTAHSGSALGVFGFVAGWIGVDTTTPEDAATVFSSSAPATTWQPTGITTANANAQAVSIVVTDDDNALAFAAAGDSGFTDRASGTSYHTTIGGDTAFGLADRLMQTAGAVTQPTWEETVLGTDAWVGAALALRAAVAGGNITVTPDTASLVITAFIPTVTPSDHKTVVPGVASLVLASFAPTIGIGVVPTTASLTLTTFAPTVTATNHQTVTPGVASLTLATFAPTVTAGAGLTVTPTTASLSLTAFAPTTVLTDHKIVTPDVAALTLTTFAPNVQAGAGLTVVPSPASLAMTAFAPTVVLSDNKTVTPGVAALSLTAFAPTAVLSDNKLVTPDVASLVFGTFAPNVGISANQTAVPTTAALLLSTFAPTVLAGGMALPDDLVASFVMAGRPTAGLASAGRSEATVGD